MAYAAYIATALLVWTACRIVYLRHLHPLAHVPGPFWASVTELYRFYHDWIQNGTYYRHFEAYQARYGPVIRIAPNEVLLTDPCHYDTLYSMTTDFYKDPAFYHLSGAETAVFAITHNKDHQRHRALLNPFFSRRSVLQQEGMVRSKVLRLLNRIQQDSQRGLTTELWAGFRAISVDVITEYAFGADRCWDFLGREDFGVWYNHLARAVVPTMYLFRVVPWLRRPMQAMPVWLARRLNPMVVGMLEFMDVTRRDVERVVGDVEHDRKPERETIFHGLLDPEATKAQGLVGVPTVQNMVDEAFGFLGAASETAGNAMTMCAFHVLYDREIYKRLRAELVQAFPDPTTQMDLLALEKLPYLTAVIKEGLRLSYGVIHPLPRVAPKAVEFNGYVLPEGTVVSMSAWLMHRHPDAFPDPDRFDPDRWLDAGRAFYLEKFLVPFSKGNRNCIGQPLAMCEVYLAIALLFRRFDDLEAIDVGPEDLVYEDYFGAFYPKDARKFKVMRRER
ncbi:cytochrome P450 [Echria macrotheca]|uniref:Cytochrome P450 n=1 Tax=Echria macrotheca TaxID=438768 RepID=A0AAJ0BA40_9PEZI|nr:cytochrome P450 [Echria macrotheca]